MPLLDRIAKVNQSREIVAIPGSLPDLAKPKPFEEVGVSGLLRTRGVGYLYEEWMRELSTARAKQIYREMRDNDAVIGAMFFAMEMILRRAEWRMEPADGPKGEEYAEFVHGCMEDMSSTWEDFIAECVSMYAFGFVLFETVYKRRQGADGRKASKFDDGLIGWRKFAPRAQESILYWIWDDDGGLQGAVQLAAPDYKTVPIPIEKLLLFRTTSLKNNPEGRSLLRNCFRCFDDQTEILTESGWKFGLDISASDKVAVLRDGKFLEYEKPSEIHRYEYKGDLIHFNSRSLDQAVTPNHEVWVRRGDKAARERVRADEASVGMRHKRDAVWEGKEVKSHIVPAYDVIAHEQNGKVNVREHREPIEIPMDDWLAFLGIFIAEGHVPNGAPVNIERRADGRRPVWITITQKRGAKADVIRKMLARLPFHVGEKSKAGDNDVMSFSICGRQLWDHLRVLGKAHDKFVPDYVKSLSARQISIFLDAFHLGEGGMGGDANGYEGTKLYFTSSRRLADDLCELVLKAGGCPSLTELEYAPASGHLGGNMFKVTHGRQPDSRPRSITREPYEGLVWCVTTKAGVVYVRRNGKCQWSGNSWFFKRRIEEIEGIGIERDLCGIPVLKASAEAITQMGGMAVATNLVTGIRRDDQMGVVLPQAYDDKGNELVKLELLRAAGARQTDPGATIQRYNSDMLNTVLAGFIQLGQTPTGSFSLHMSASQIFATALQGFMDSIAAVVNRIAIPRLMSLNKMDLKQAPKLMAGELGVRDLEELGDYVQKLSASGLTFFDKETANYLRKQGRLPEEPEDMPEAGPAPNPNAPVAGPRTALPAKGVANPQAHPNGRATDSVGTKKPMPTEAPPSDAGAKERLAGEDHPDGKKPAK